MLAEVLLPGMANKVLLIEDDPFWALFWETVLREEVSMLLL